MLSHLIPPCYYQRNMGPQVSFDTANNQFLVVWIGTSVGYPFNVYGRLVPADGLPANGGYPTTANPGDCPLTPPFVFAITDYGSTYYAARPRVQFDSVITQYLVTWGNQTDGMIYGHRIGGSGALLGPEITIAKYTSGGSAYLPNLVFDPINEPFFTNILLQCWGYTWTICKL